MKKLIMISVCALACVAGAANETIGEYVEGERSVDQIPTNAVQMLSMMFSPAEARMMVHALRLQMTKYDKDMMSVSGRTDWHGPKLYDAIDTNTMTMVEIHSNKVTGAIWKYRKPFKPAVRKPKNPATQLDRLKNLPTNGVPARIIEARRKRIEVLERGTIYTNVVINVGIESVPVPLPNQGGIK